MSTIKQFILIITTIACVFMSIGAAQSQTNTTTPLAVGTAATEVLSFDTDKQRKLYQTLILELRCPKCQNQNIADSNADIAQDMRKKVYEMVLQNKPKNEIKQFMLARFGEFVLYKPQFSGKTLLLWLAPIALFFLAGFFVVRLIRRNAIHLDNEQTPD